MKANITEVWTLINSLNIDEKRIIYKRLEQEINNKLLDLLNKVNERADKDFISFAEVTKEVEDVRGYLYEKD